MGTLIAQLLENTNNPPKICSIYSVGLPPPKQRESEEKIRAHVKNALLGAKRYHFSSAATEMASLYGFNVEDPVEQLIKLAVPPFDHMWIEWPLKSQMEAVGVETADDAPTLVGVTIKKYDEKFYIVTPYFQVAFPNEKNVSLPSPISFIFSPYGEIEDLKSFNHPINYFIRCLRETLTAPKDRSAVKYTVLHASTKQEIDAAEALKMNTEELTHILRTTLVGGGFDQEKTLAAGYHQAYPERQLLSMHPIGKQSNDSLLETLTRHAILTFTPGWGDVLAKRSLSGAISVETVYTIGEVFAETILEHSGMCRFILGALALMNTKKYVRSQNIKPGQKNPEETTKPSRSLKRPTPNYEFVELTVPNTVIIKEIQGHNHEKRERSRHEVARHLCYSHQVGDENCHHNFAKQSQTKEICLLCGAKRWWRKAHERGSESVGRVEHHSRLVMGN